MTYSLARQGVYRSLQGEGALLGVPMVFVRLAGCSIGCAGCDTDYRHRGTLHGGETIAREAAALAAGASWAWITGGEPTDRDLGPLVAALKAEGFGVAVATAGVRALPPGIDWISVSPHAPGRPAQFGGHELKLVPGLNGLKLAECDPRDYLSFPYRYAQPCAGRVSALAECKSWVDRNPGWRLGIQAQKQWGLA